MDISSMLSNEAGNSDVPDKRTVLLNSIDSANLDRVRKVLKEICTENTAAFDLACAKMLVQDDNSSNGTSAKRKRQPTQRFETCMQCKAEYDTTNNPSDTCCWHSGYTNPDLVGDFWAGYDEDCHGTIDSDWAREKYPKGFRWSCCGCLGDVKGCEIDVHRPEAAKKIKVDLVDDFDNYPPELLERPYIQQYRAGSEAKARSASHPQRVDPLAEFDHYPQELLDRPYIQQAIAELEGRAPSRPLREPYRRCIQCEQTYDTLANTKASCSWHSGELEAIYESDIWADHDERCHGPIDTQENQRNFRKGFMWDCCERKGDEPGCELDVHRSEV